MRQQIQCSNHTESTITKPQNRNKCPPVCIKPHTPHRTITNAPRYVSNHTLHTDLNIPYVREVINERIDKHLNKLEYHPNPLLQTLAQPTRNRRLKRRWTSDPHD